MKVGIIGSGFVGATTAFAIMMQRCASEIVLVDVNKKRAVSEAADITHAVPFARAISVTAGDYRDLAGSTLVIITAGAKQQPGESRLGLLGRNAVIMRDMVGSILEYSPDAILLVASNPVDSLTHLAARCAAGFGVPAERVIGSGTTLDTARFRSLLGKRLGVDPQHVHGYVVGEHGDSEVMAWSILEIAGHPLEEFCRLRGIAFDSTARQEIDDSVRGAAYHIIEGKQATYYGIAAALAHITDIIAANRRAILTVCASTAEIAGVRDVTISLPRLIGAEGVIATLPLHLDATENERLRLSAELIRQSIAACEC